MIAFEVPDMTCGHCANAITRAVQAADGGARVQVDLDRKQVRIDAAQRPADALQAAIQAAGYHPVPLPQRQ